MIYPNPTADFAKINLSLKSSDVVNVNIFDLYGKRVNTFNTAKLPQGENTIDIDLSDLATGTYVVSLHVNGVQTHSGRVAVSK